MTEPEENAFVYKPTVRMMGTIASCTVGFSIVAFSSEPVNGKHLAVWLVFMPQAPNPRTVGVATFKDMCDYMSASFNVKRVKILFWKYSLIFEITTPFDKDFDV